MPTLTVAFCTFKRADRLDKLVGALRAQSCPAPFDILAVNNDSPDDTLEVLARLQREPGAPLRIVTETAPGIVPARNRALAETLGRDILVFIDDDELPQAGFLAAAYDAIANEGTHCAGGRIEIDFSPCRRPGWLDDEVAGFLGRLDHGAKPFWIADDTTPVWSGNTAYAMPFFRDHPELRFDARFNRTGEGVGGGEDAMMLRALLDLGARIRYRPDMAVWHGVDPWKLTPRYFLQLHYRAGLRHGQFRLPAFPHTVFGIPPFLLRQFLRHCLTTLKLLLSSKSRLLRQGMNTTHALGLIVGYQRRSQT
ncbi:glycosyltransferase family 2 protein [Thiobacillus denitrificans]|uniref:glycosyltransferase family 2 protein n=1 Tax=Thiobacillus denitrificans TaxID=36861 RepID=UPI000362FCEC|nr:glycosyltransferase family 2 protein [Thiobacillus denitrificans]